MMRDYARAKRAESSRTASASDRQAQAQAERNAKWRLQADNSIRSGQ